ncbi:CPBP family intramembrane glutamic endopeptidase [Corynebacterium epidermidicanis]|uniref:CPBP family intramembrane glutamic endopeptidase n=1 Tax=Corynebacterium epidermidicanis TaxID=1050174 RepID=UPI00130E4CD6|nr:CPBP family intramembrane glutamic endopeptidase [Corynebacterium epidermidicanis]
MIAFALTVPLFGAIHAPADGLMWVNHLASGAVLALLANRMQSIIGSAVLHGASNVSLIILDSLTSYSSGDTAGVLWGKLLAMATVAVVVLVLVSRGERHAPQTVGMS